MSVSAQTVHHHSHHGPQITIQAVLFFTATTARTTTDNRAHFAGSEKCGPVKKLDCVFCPFPCTHLYLNINLTSRLMAFEIQLGGTCNERERLLLKGISQTSTVQPFLLNMAMRFFSARGPCWLARCGWIIKIGAAQISPLKILISFASHLASKKPLGWLCCVSSRGATYWLAGCRGRSCTTARYHPLNIAGIAAAQRGN